MTPYPHPPKYWQFGSGSARHPLGRPTFHGPGRFIPCKQINCKEGRINEEVGGLGNKRRFTIAKMTGRHMGGD